jgi:hypothetical protein
VRTFDFTAEPEGKKGLIEAARGGGEIVSVHLPTQLLGAAAGLRPGQRRLLQALVRELVRHAKSGRPDRAALVKGGRVPGARAGTALDCPLLSTQRRYVAFNGNGRPSRRGRGYRLFGARGTGWVHKAGYEVPGDDAGRRRSLLAFLEDVKGLEEPFGLVVAALDPQTGQWFGLDGLLSAAGVAGGWRVLDRYHVRFYGPADYLERWRRHLASRAAVLDVAGAGQGESQEEGGGGSSRAVEVAGGDAVLGLRVRMRQAGVTERELAEQLGCSASFVCMVLKGKKRPPAELLGRAEAYVAGRATAEHEVNTAEHEVNQVTISAPKLTSR